jgi:hypothetical protein
MDMVCSVSYQAICVLLDILLFKDNRPFPVDGSALRETQILKGITMKGPPRIPLRPMQSSPQLQSRLAVGIRIYTTTDKALDRSEHRPLFLPAPYPPCQGTHQTLNLFHRIPRVDTYTDSLGFGWNCWRHNWADKESLALADMRKFPGMRCA